MVTHSRKEEAVLGAASNFFATFAPRGRESSAPGAGRMWPQRPCAVSPGGERRTVRAYDGPAHLTIPSSALAVAWDDTSSPSYIPPGFAGTRNATFEDQGFWEQSLGLRERRLWGTAGSMHALPAKKSGMSEPPNVDRFAWPLHGKEGSDIFALQHVVAASFQAHQPSLSWSSSSSTPPTSECSSRENATAPAHIMPDEWQGPSALTPSPVGSCRREVVSQTMSRQNLSTRSLPAFDTPSWHSAANGKQTAI